MWKLGLIPQLFLFWEYFFQIFSFKVSIFGILSLQCGALLRNTQQCEKNALFCDEGIAVLSVQLYLCLVGSSTVSLEEFEGNGVYFLLVICLFFVTFLASCFSWFELR
jgi:hypothetical protein